MFDAIGNTFADAVNTFADTMDWDVMNLDYNDLDDVIFGTEARFPLCFPNGYPDGAPPKRCYKPGWGGSLYSARVPCLPPIIHGKLIPPCRGPFVVIDRIH